MKIYLIGPGAVGGYIAAHLMKSGADITVVAHGETYKEISKKGLSVESIDGDFELDKINIISSISQIENPDVVLITTKTYSNRQVAQELADVVKSTTAVVSIQNGIANDLEIMKSLANCNVYPGLIYLSSFKKSLNTIKHIGGLNLIRFGDRFGGESKVLKELVKIFEETAIKVELSEDIEQDLWEKYIFVSAFSGLTALCRASIGKIVKYKRTLALYEMCVKEGIELAHLIGVNLPVTIFEDIMHITVSTKSDSKSSLLLDIENGRATEIETLTGTLVHLGNNNNLDLPINETIYGAISLLEQ